MIYFLKQYRFQMVAFVAVIAGAVVAALFFKEEIAQFIAYLQSSRVRSDALIAAFLILPVFFFPLSALLILLGIRFNIVYGILIMFALMPAHLLFSFVVVRWLFGDKVEKWARKRNYTVFQIPENRYTAYGFMLMAIPGLPYALKNYLLPLSGIPFRHYFLIGWLVQGLFGVPFIVFGEAASKLSVELFLIFMGLFLIAWAVTKYVRKRYDGMMKSVSKESVDSTSNRR